VKARYRRRSECGWSVNPQSDTPETSSRSPGCIPVSAAAPAGSSNTEWARRQAAKRQERMCGRIFKTRLSRLKNTTSIGKRMPMVCTDSQGTIQSPSPGCRQSRPSKPRRRVALVSATCARSAITIARSRFLMLTVSKVNTRLLANSFAGSSSLYLFSGAATEFSRLFPIPDGVDLANCPDCPSHSVGLRRTNFYS
jgi:hypothetical protein